MNAQNKCLFFLISALMFSCNLPKEGDTSKYPKCSDSKFKKMFFTYCNLHNTDSVIIESYQKGSGFKYLNTRRYYHFAEKNRIHASKYHPESWTVVLADSLDADYDYRFVFQDDGAFVTYQLTELTIEPLAEFKGSGKIEYKCELGSWKIGDHKYFGGDFAFY